MNGKDKKYLWALDISLSCTGIAIYDLGTDKFVLVDSIPTDKVKSKKDRYHNALKLKHIEEKIINLAIDFPPSLLVMERGFSRFPTSTQVIFRTHGLINYLFHEVNQLYFPPKTIKEAILKGNATKKEVREAIEKTYDYIDFKNEDESDAVSIGLCYLIKNELINWVKPEVPKKTTKNKKAKPKVEKIE